jgi:hypothetical protein
MSRCRAADHEGGHRGVGICRDPHQAIPDRYGALSKHLPVKVRRVSLRDGDRFVIGAVHRDQPALGQCLN